MLEMSWITAVLQFYGQVTDLFGNVIVRRIHIRLFDLLARCHYILNPLVIIYCIGTYLGPTDKCWLNSRKLLTAA